MIRHLITGGCSFSTGDDDNGWVGCLTQVLRKQNPNLTTNHCGRNSSGQELIQKRVMSAIISAMESGIESYEILVAVMWSGTSRKSWFIDNPTVIERMVNDWPNFHGGMTHQFLNLTNDDIDGAGVFYTKNGSEFKYNKAGGWYLTVNGSDSQLEFVQQHYMLDKEVNGVGKTHSSLENIIMLQNFCKLYNIKLINQFFMKHVYKDIIRHKDHEIVNYLYKQFDHTNTITQGMFEYLHKFIEVSEDNAVLLSHDERKNLQNKYNLEYFAQDGFHPSQQGYELWCKDVLFPKIKRLL
jgi:hypothetical protein